MPKSPAFVWIKADVLRITCTVPEGHVTTYGAIGDHLAVMARHVAYILATLTDEEQEDVPWHRVVADRGAISATQLETRGRVQIARLLDEGIRVTARNTVEGFEEVFWSPDGEDKNAARRHGSD